MATTNRAVKTSCKNTKIRTASGACAPERKPMMKKGGATKALPKAQFGNIFKQNDPDANFIQNVRRNSLINRSKKVGEKINNSAKTGDRENFIKLINTQDKLDNKRYELRKKIDNKKVGGTAHPGFKSVQSSIAAKQGISKEAAGAILASSTRKASAKAKAANPRLKRVK